MKKNSDEKQIQQDMETNTLLKLKDTELVELWKAKWNGSQASFCRQYGEIHQGNFSQWLRGQKSSPASRMAIIQFLSAETTSSETDTTAAISKTPCKYYLKGCCTLGNLCPFLHPKSLDITYTSYVLQQQQCIHPKLAKQKKLELIIFMDTDQLKSNDVEQLLSLSGIDPIHLIFIYTPKQHEFFSKKEKQSNQQFSFVSSITTSKNAVDIAITSVATRLDVMLEKSIDFCFISDDWFVVELCEQIKANGRNAINSNQVSNEIIKNWSTSRKWITQQKNVNLSNAKLELLLRDTLQKVKQWMSDNNCNSVLLSKIGETFPLQEELKDVYFNWTTVFQTPFAEDFLKGTVQKNSKNQPILRIDSK